MNIVIYGAGYVGLANAFLLSKRNKISLVDIDKEKINLLNMGISPIGETDIHNALKDSSNISFVTSMSFKEMARINTVLLCLPTNWDIKKKKLDTEKIKSQLIILNKLRFRGLIVIRSTVSIGFTKDMQSQFKNLNICFIPEFLREGNALHDSLNPSRIIYGDFSVQSEKFVNELVNCSLNQGVTVKHMSSCEAEATKLFSNAYLANRVAFFNELDSFSIERGLNAKNIIQGMSLDERIGDFYNNPSFGFGGYCLPKDTLQLKYEFSETTPTLISASLKANHERSKFIVNLLCGKGIKNIGIYKINMKSGSDNFRNSSSLNLIKLLKKENFNIFIFEPLLDQETFKGCRIINELNEFLDKSEIIIANRLDENISKLESGKIFSRDLFLRN